MSLSTDKALIMVDVLYAAFFKKVNKLKPEPAQTNQFRKRTNKLLFIQMFLVAIFMSYWYLYPIGHTIINWVVPDDYWVSLIKVWWLPLLFSLIFLYKHKLSDRVCGLLVVLSCFVYNLYLSHLEIIRGVGILILIACLAAEYNQLKNRRLMVLSGIFILVTFYKFKSHRAFEMNPFGKGYALTSESVEWAISNTGFTLYYVSMVSLTTSFVIISILNLKNKSG